jgi:CRISPR-associated protein Csb2
MAVPNNDLDVVAKAWCKRQEPKKQPSELKTLKSVRPTRLILKDKEPGTVHYLFPLDDSDSAFEKHRQVLFTAARDITHLGWGIDMAAGHASVVSEEEAANMSGERWRPVEDASAKGYRVPMQGTLQALIDKHEAFLKRLGPDGFKPVPRLSTFRVIGYRRTIDPPSRPFGAFAFYRLDADKRRSFPVTRAIAVAGMVRCLTRKMARETGHGEEGTDLDQWVNDYVLGHGESEGIRPRFSYLPLPTIRPPNALGDLYRVIIAEPPGGSGAHCAWASRTLRGQILLSEQQKEEALLLSVEHEDGVLPRYVSRSATWATVTPVVLPGSDEGKFAKAEKLFLKALLHAGYSSEALADLEFRNVSFWPGGDLALTFQRPAYLKRDYWSVYHVRLRWRQPIAGPLAIGAGRHCGLGIFAVTNG